jgi:phage shock protein PspC (stress-responsive transcriptional regulator)
MKPTTRRLLRSRQDKMLAGVASGIGSYFGVDPILVRIAFVVLTLTHGAGLLAYLLLWLVMPAEPKQETPQPTGDARAHGGYAFVAGGSMRRARFDPMTGEPLDPEQEIPIHNLESDDDADTKQMRRNWLLGTALVALGVFFFLKMLFPGLMPFLFPGLLIGAGIYLLSRNRDNDA